MSIFQTAASRTGDFVPITFGRYARAARQKRFATIAIALSPIGIVIVSIARLLIISNYNVSTASAIASSAGYVDTFLGSLIPIVPLFLPFVSVALLYFERPFLGFLGIIAATLISPIAPGAWAVLKRYHVVPVNGAPALLAMLGAAIVAIILSRSGALQGIGSTIGVIASILLVPVALELYVFPLHSSFYSNLIRQPWLPATSIQLNSGNHLVGYVLSDSGTWIEMLNASDRSVVHIRDADVKSLALCRLGGITEGKPLIVLSSSAHASTVATPLCT